MFTQIKYYLFKKENKDKSIKTYIRNKEAFTLIEMLLVVSIVSIIATFSTAFYSRFINQNSVNNIQDQIISQARKAQTYAMQNKQNANWGIYYSTNVLTLYSGSSYASRNSSFDETFEFNSNITVTGISDVNFTKNTGKPNTTASITITSPNGSKTVNINAQGNIEP